MRFDWPIEYSELIRLAESKWKVASDRGIQVVAEYKTGRSGARVYRVDIGSAELDGQAILKLGTVGSTGGAEPSKHFAAAEEGGSWVENHLVRPIAVCEHEDQFALLSSLAGETTLLVQPASALGHSELIRTFRALSKGLLSGWNESPDLSEPAGPASRALRAWLGDRLYEEKGGGLPQFLRDRSLSLDASAFTLRDEVYPNPLNYALQTRWTGEDAAKFVRGRQHGDLHSDNILVRLRPQESEYHLIDLSHYAPVQYLFYDHAYLELSRLLSDRGSVTVDRWMDLLGAVTGPDVFSTGYHAVEADDVGILQVVKAIREPMNDWSQASAGHGRHGDLARQAVLARVAVGLNFANKEGLDGSKRELAFLFSATNLKRYFKNFEIQWRKAGAPIRLSEQPRRPENASWRLAWDHCDQFDPRRHFVLVAGSGVRALGSHDLAVLANVPWRLVIDFDSASKDGGLREGLGSELNRRRGLQELVVDASREVAHHAATEWFYANGTTVRTDLRCENYRDWRRKYAGVLATRISKLCGESKPGKTIVLVLPEGIQEEMLRSTWELLDNEYGADAKYVFLGDLERPGFLGDEDGGLVHVRCSLGNLVSGLWRMFGQLTESKSVLVPSRSEDGAERSLVALSAEDYQYLSEDLEVVHMGRGGDVEEDDSVGRDFWRGHEITWPEIALGMAVARDISDELYDACRESLDRSLERLPEIRLSHEPGSGGTTIAKTLAWRMKLANPTVMLRRYSRDTAARLSALYSVSGGLPLFIVVEDAEVPAQDRMRLISGLRERSLRATILVVERTGSPSGTFRLQTPMEQGDSRRFARAYAELAMTLGGREAIHRLATSPEDRPYRSPFFFGLYAFEDRYVKIPDFVSTILGGASRTDNRLLGYLALVTKYSTRTGLRPEDIVGMTGQPESDFLSDLAEGALGRLILYRDRSARLVHPVVALEVLNQLYGSDSDLNRWRRRLPDLCCDFIRAIAEVRGDGNEELWDLLEQLFIAREGEDNERRRFSDLIHDVATTAGQNRVLRQLTQSFPGNAHFWTHLGRHNAIAMQSSLAEAEKCVREAIAIEAHGAVHYHVLGDIYRHEIKRLISTGANSAEASFEEVRPLLAEAFELYETSIRLAPDSRYGYVGSCQLVVQTTTRLFELTQHPDYGAFLSGNSPISAWAREHVALASQYLSELHSIGLSDKNPFVSELRERMRGFFSQGLANMLDGLRGLLGEDGHESSHIRRVIVSAHLNHAKRQWRELSNRQLREVRDLMGENLEWGDWNPHDLRNWFRASRRLDDFDLVRALEEFERWSQEEPADEAYFYLYVLNFLMWRKGVGRQEVVKDYIALCQEAARAQRGNRSWEWLMDVPKWCPIMHSSDRRWDSELRFFADETSLVRLQGEIKYFKGPQAGYIAFDAFDVFFPPGDFQAGRDEGERVSFYLGFSYSGLRAWKVERLNRA